MIELKNIRKEYELVTPVEDLNLTIEEGDVISIIGPSGTGKSTILRMINMLERPTSGQIFFNGEDITQKKYDLSKYRQKVGMVFQNYNLFNHMTVLENVIDAPISLKGTNETEAKVMAMELLKQVGMADFAASYPGELSGGQKQRVAIARAIAMQPKVILFDEPTSALDPTMVGEVEAVIKKLKDFGYTMLLVTHDMSFAETVANRVIFLAEGGVYEDGTPEQIFHHPTREKTKEFIMKLRTLNCVIDKPTFDFISFRSQLDLFIYKNEMPGEVARRLRAITEEFIGGIILPFMDSYSSEGWVFKIDITYSAKHKGAQINVKWNLDAENYNDEYQLSSKIIEYYADEIIIQDNKSLLVRIMESSAKK